MVCPSCGTAVEVPGKFCATCGAALPETPATETTNQEAPASNGEPAAPAEAPAQETAPEAAPVAPAPVEVQPAAPAPPPWAQTGPGPQPPAPPAWTPPPPAQAAPPQWPQPGPTAPAPAPYPPQQPYAAPQYGAPQYGAPQYGAPQAPGYGVPQYGAPGYAVAQPRAAAPARGGAAMIGGLLAAAGGGAAVASAWLAWEATKSGDALIKPMDVGFDSKNLTELATGPYLIAAGALAAVCGLLLLIGIARTRGLRGLLAVGAALGGVAVLAVEYTAYGHVNDSVNAFGAFAAIGIGLYIGAAGGVAALVGAVLALTSNP